MLINMLIIKRGKKPVTYMQFHCEACGCDFIANNSEYIKATNLVPERVFANCPTCNHHVSALALEAEVSTEEYNKNKSQNEPSIKE